MLLEIFPSIAEERSRLRAELRGKLGDGVKKAA
jgi:hypothetical protein